MEFGKVGNQIISSNRKQNSASYNNAINFYKEKLAVNPDMPKYNHYMGVITSSQGKTEEADKYYRQALSNDPSNLNIKNDFAIHLAKEGRSEDAAKELRRALLIQENSSTLNNNMAAVLATSGDYRKALGHAVKANLANDKDDMNLRNIARLQAALGDRDSSLEHNMKAIAIQEHNALRRGQPITNTAAYRKAAVQMVSKGAPREEAIAMMNRARELENKHPVLVTTERTNEILKKIKKQQEQHLLTLEQARRKAEEDKQTSYGYWQELVDKVPA